MSSPYKNSPFGANVVAGLVPVVLMIVRHMSAKTLRGLWNDGVFYMSWRVLDTPGVTQRGPG